MCPKGRTPSLFLVHISFSKCCCMSDLPPNTHGGCITKRPLGAGGERSSTEFGHFPSHVGGGGGRLLCIAHNHQKKRGGGVPNRNHGRPILRPRCISGQGDCTEGGAMKTVMFLLCGPITLRTWSGVWLGCGGEEVGGASSLECPPLEMKRQFFFEKSFPHDENDQCVMGVMHVGVPGSPPPPGPGWRRALCTRTPFDGVGPERAWDCGMGFGVPERSIGPCVVHRQPLSHAPVEYPTERQPLPVVW